MVPGRLADASASGADRRLAGAWQGKNLRDILTTPRLRRRHALARPAEEGPRLDPVHRRAAAWCAGDARSATAWPRPYKGRFWSARQLRAAHPRRLQEHRPCASKALRFMETGPCPACDGSGLRPEALAVTFAGHDHRRAQRRADDRAGRHHPPHRRAHRRRDRVRKQSSGEAQRGGRRHHPRPRSQRVTVLLDLGLGYLALGRSTPTLSPGEMQRLRIATQLRSGLFGVSTCSTSPPPACTRPTPSRCSRSLDQLKSSGNSLFVVEHDMDVVRRADWIVDVGPARRRGRRRGALQRPAGRPRRGGGLVDPARYLFRTRPRDGAAARGAPRARREPAGCDLRGISRAQPAATSTPTSRSAC